MRSVVMVALLALGGSAAWAKRPAPPPPKPDLSVRWAQSGEHDAATQGTYAAALDRALYAASRLPEGTLWVIVADLDETLLDNSRYQVEVTGVGYDEASWLAWERRAEAVPMSGAVAFVARVHAAGGQLAYITNRTEQAPTLQVLQAHGMWEDDDRLCVKTDGSDKTARRTAVRDGAAGCGWAGKPATVLLYLGDQRSDFPAEGEEPSDGLAPWGHRWFMLPNAMYGGWAR